MNNVCFIYPWATFGGVERVLLNRALALKQHFPNLMIDFIFFYDSGGITPLTSAVTKYGISKNVSIFVASYIEKKYDLVFIIDCPQAIKMCEERQQKYVVECHTAYRENRAYLANLPSTCELIITPSPIFSEILRNELPTPSPKIRELRNFVPWDLQPNNEVEHNYLPHWSRKPILFLGRLDRLKDPLSLLDAFTELERRRKGEFLLLICGPKSSEIDINSEISKRSLQGTSVVLPPIPFTSVNKLLRSVSQNEGLFVSPSRGESFGLSAAEAISALLPVVLSDIKAHNFLVSGFEDILTYPLGDIEQLTLRIETVFNDYVGAQRAVAVVRKKFSACGFIEDWIRLCRELDMPL